MSRAIEQAGAYPPRSYYVAEKYDGAGYESANGANLDATCHEMRF